MSLFRQIAALISIVFILVLAAVVWNDFRYSSRSLHGQNETIAQHLATTLAIAMGDSLASRDPPSVEAFFNAVFDSGYLARIELLSPEGELIHTKQQSISIRKIPSWFVSLVPFEPAVGQSPVMQGWVQTGTLRLTLHPGYAYVEMYESLKALLLWLVLITVAALVLLWWSLHFTLRPLRLVQQQADAIHQNQFIRQAVIPRTRELRSVVQAMNRLVDKVQAIFVEQENTLKRYHEVLYQDELTGLGNRRALVAKLDELREDEAAQEGFLALVHIDRLNEFSDRDGYSKADALVVSFARALEAELAPGGHELATRDSAFEFAIYLERDAAEAAAAIERLFVAFKIAATAARCEELVWLCAGLIPVRRGMDTGTILSEADFSLARARATGANEISESERDRASLPQGRMQWRALLQQCLAERRLFLVAQPVRTRDRAIEHREVFVRLRNEEGEVVPAGFFMPMAATLGLDHAIDMEVLRMVLDRTSGTQTSPLAVNLSARVFVDSGAMASLERVLEKASAERLAQPQLEVRHFLLQQHSHSAEMVCTRLREHGYRIGIDNLDLSLPLSLLKAIRPAYVKVSARVLADLAAEPGSAGLAALTTLTSTLDVRVIAFGVDSKELENDMIQLGVYGLQGNFISPAEELA